MNIARSDEEINDQLKEAMDSIDGGESITDKTYEDGVIATIRWLKGETKLSPMDDA